MKEQTRRQFLSRGFSGVAVASGGLLSLRSLSSLAATPQQPPSATPGQRSYQAGKFGLELDGQFAGWINSAQGGQAVSDEVTGTKRPGGVQTKQVGGLKFQDMLVTCRTGMSGSYYNWIKNSLGGQILRKNGAVVTCDYNFHPVSRMEWFNAAITEIGFPACDAGSKDPAKMTVKFAPEQVRFAAGSPAVNYEVNTKQPTPQKWSLGGFRLAIDGIDCSGVNKIEAINVNTHYAASQAKAPGQATGRPQEQISGIVVTLPEAYSEGFRKWFQASVVQGNTGMGEKTGKLEYLAANLNAPLFGLTFQRLMIVKLTQLPVSPGAAAIRQVQAEMYCESLGFDWSAAALA